MKLNLPDFFLIDLPEEIGVQPKLVGEACDRLKENGDRYLKPRSTSQIAHSLCNLAENWQDDEFPFRRKLIEEGAEKSGFSIEVLLDGLDRMFSQWTPEKFEFWLTQEFGHVERLDNLVSTRMEARENKSSIVRGPQLITHITSGNLPVPAIMSMVTGLLVKSSQFIKCASGASFVPRLFAHSLYQHDSKLGACLEIAEWKGGRSDIESILYEKADIVTVSGSDKAVDNVGEAVPHTSKFLDYGHKVSFGYISRKSISGLGLKRLVSAAAQDVMRWDQHGCLSPHVFYVQQKGIVPPEKFAEMLAEELEKQRLVFPRAPLSVRESATMRSRRSFYEIRSATSKDTVLYASQDGTDWTVIYEDDIRFQTSCGNRFIYIKGVGSLDEALHGAVPIQEKISTVALSAADDESDDLAKQIANWGASRICPIGQMQDPPLHWRHDGRPALAELISWSEWEM